MLVWDVKLIVQAVKYLQYLPGINILVAAAKALEDKSIKDQTFFDQYSKAWQSGRMSLPSNRPRP